MTASGQHRPEEELTATTAPFSILETAEAALVTFECKFRTQSISNHVVKYFHQEDVESSFRIQGGKMVTSNQNVDRCGFINHDRLPRIRSAAFSATMMVGALVFEPIMLGKIEESHILNRSMPWTRSSGSTTAIVPVPILHVPFG